LAITKKPKGTSISRQGQIIFQIRVVHIGIFGYHLGESKDREKAVRAWFRFSGKKQKIKRWAKAEKWTKGN
jgi:hypothetical protein